MRPEVLRASLHAGAVVLWCASGWMKIRRGAEEERSRAEREGAQKDENPPYNRSLFIDIPYMQSINMLLRLFVVGWRIDRSAAEPARGRPRERREGEGRDGTN